MEDYLIVVDPDYLDQLAMNTKPHSSLDAQAKTTPTIDINGLGLSDDLLTQRAITLTDMAQTMLDPFALTNPSLGDLADRLKSLDYVAHEHAETQIAYTIEPLEGIGAVIVRDTEQRLEALNDIPGVTAFHNEEVELVKALVDYSSQSSLPAIDPEDLYWHLRQVGLGPGTPGGEGIVVGMLDTGIDPEHDEFVGKHIHFQRFNEKGEKVDIRKQDSHGHGTHVASLAVGNTVGTAPDADIAVASVHKDRFSAHTVTGYICQVAAGLNWLVTEPFTQGRTGADVINCSLSLRTQRESLRSAIQKGLGQQILCIAAIGNRGVELEGNHGAPGEYPETLSVGATDRADMVIQLSDWASTNPYDQNAPALPEISAPGFYVYGARVGGGYVESLGTSMAAPIVTGIAARRISKNPNLLRKAFKLRDSLLSETDEVTKNDETGATGGVGRIKA